MRRWWAQRTRTTGYPTSSNRASSMHLVWELPPSPEPVTGALVDLTVETLPAVDDLYFWALQASFTDAAGRQHGGGHLGLQWHPAHPGARAVNWGGYGPGGAELVGGGSSLPSATGNPNTRDLAWRGGRQHRLHIARVATGWAGRVDGIEVRTLAAGGDRLTGLMVWSEVFAPCNAPTVVARWSGLHVDRGDGRREAVGAVRAAYQSRAAGGCDNTTAVADGDGLRQITATPRVVPAGERLTVGPGR